MTTPDWAELTRFAIALGESLGQGDPALFPAEHPCGGQGRSVWDPSPRVTGPANGHPCPDRETLPGAWHSGEEYGVKLGQSPFTWVLDPVDGTRSFVCGMPTWATLIGLSFEGRPVVGLMNQPVVGDMFYGNPEAPGLITGAAPHPSPPARGSRSPAPPSAPRRPNSTAARKTSAASRRSAQRPNSPATAGMPISSA